LAARSIANIRLEMKGSILPWSSGTLSLFERCTPSFTAAQRTLRTHEELDCRECRSTCPPMRGLGIMGGGRSRGTGPATADPARGVQGRMQPGAQSYADEFLLKLNMTIWNATIYCVLVVRDTVMVSLR
jgi:hypothetical protein